MTAIGKMLVFIVLVLSLMWNFLTLNAYVTRTNWRNEAKKYQDRAGEAALSATKMNELLTSERAAAQDARQALLQQTERGNAQVAQLAREREVLLAQFGAAFTQAAANATAATTQDAVITTQGTQVKTLADQDKLATKLISDLKLDREKASVEADQAKIAAEALRKQNEDLVGKVQRLTADNAALARNGGRPGGVSDGLTPPAPSDFRGTVTEVGTDNLMAISGGVDHGLAVGMVLTVQRLTPTGRYLGKLKLTEVHPKTAVGQFTPSAPSRDPAARPKAGDEVVPATSTAAR